MKKIDDVFQEVMRKVNPAYVLVNARKLTGGVSAAVTACTVALPDGTRETLVVRQYGEANLKSNQHIARDECQLLALLEKAKIPAPRPYLFDESNEILPSPYLVTSFIEGKTVEEPMNVTEFVRQMADVLIAIHAAKISRGLLSSLPDQTDHFAKMVQEAPVRLDESLSEGAIRAALRSSWPPVQKNASVLLHGDFWPGNTMWKDESLAAVIDWEDAAFGDPLADIGNARLEILMFFGADATMEFTRRYQQHAGLIDYINLPYWDLVAALRPAGVMEDWGLDDTTLAKLRDGHKAFVNKALDAIGRL